MFDQKKPPEKVLFRKTNSAQIEYKKNSCDASQSQPIQMMAHRTKCNEYNRPKANQLRPYYNFARASIVRCSTRLPFSIHMYRNLSSSFIPMQNIINNPIINYIHIIFDSNSVNSCFVLFLRNVRTVQFSYQFISHQRIIQCHIAKNLFEVAFFSTS